MFAPLNAHCLVLLSLSLTLAFPFFSLQRAEVRSGLLGDVGGGELSCCFLDPSACHPLTPQRQDAAQEGYDDAKESRFASTDRACRCRKCPHVSSKRTAHV
jgi:hypothetical protein